MEVNYDFPTDRPHYDLDPDFQVFQHKVRTEMMSYQDAYCLAQLDQRIKWKDSHAQKQHQKQWEEFVTEWLHSKKLDPVGDDDSIEALLTPRDEIVCPGYCALSFLLAALPLDLIEHQFPLDVIKILNVIYFYETQTVIRHDMPNLQDCYPELSRPSWWVWYNDMYDLASWFCCYTVYEWQQKYETHACLFKSQ
jgi:hypothetical protein